MKHPGGDAGVDRSGQVRLAGRIEPRGAAQRMREVAAEIEQSVAFGVEDRAAGMPDSALMSRSFNTIALLFTRPP